MGRAGGGYWGRCGQRWGSWCWRGFRQQQRGGCHGWRRRWGPFLAWWRSHRWQWASRFSPFPCFWGELLRAKRSHFTLSKKGKVEWGNREWRIIHYASWGRKGRKKVNHFFLRSFRGGMENNSQEDTLPRRPSPPRWSGRLRGGGGRHNPRAPWRFPSICRVRLATRGVGGWLVGPCPTSLRWQCGRWEHSPIIKCKKYIMDWDKGKNSGRKVSECDTSRLSHEFDVS